MHTIMYHVSSISPRPINEITYMELQNIISDMLKSGLSYSSCKKVRSLLNQLYSFAIINDWCSKSYSQYLNIGHNIPKRPRKVFTTNQINRLWNLNAELPLILLYTALAFVDFLYRNRPVYHYRFPPLAKFRTKHKINHYYMLH